MGELLNIEARNREWTDQLNMRMRKGWSENIRANWEKLEAAWWPQLYPKCDQ